MNLTQCIIKQSKIFPTITREQLFRLVKSYNGENNMTKFNIELDYLISKKIIANVTE